MTGVRAGGEAAPDEARHEEARRSPLVLASASPRRQEILRWADIPFTVHPSDAENDWAAGRGPLVQVRWSAVAKALGVAADHPGRLVLGADTVVALGRRVLGKPADPLAAAEMLRALSGRRHVVHTALVLVWGGDKEPAAIGLDSSWVTFASLSEAQVAAYVASGEPLDKAGAYGIQSPQADFVREVIGSYLNVVGLPLACLQEMLAALGWVI